MKEVYLVAINPTIDDSEYGPLYCQTNDVAELRRTIEALDPGATVTVVTPVSQFSVVLYLAELRLGSGASSESATLCLCGIPAAPGREDCGSWNCVVGFTYTEQHGGPSYGTSGHAVP